MAEDRWWLVLAVLVQGWVVAVLVSLMTTAMITALVASVAVAIVGLATGRYPSRP